jgi:hypothetical protein
VPQGTNQNISTQADVLINPLLSLIMWENRDIYTEYPNTTAVAPYSLFFVSVVGLPINPYYWHPAVYNYSAFTTFQRNQTYFSPLFKELTLNTSK